MQGILENLSDTALYYSCSKVKIFYLTERDKQLNYLGNEKFHFTTLDAPEVLNIVSRDIPHADIGAIGKVQQKY